MSTPPPLLPPRTQSTFCVSIIGMAGSGKTVVGRALAEVLGWAHVDTDHLIEATYGTQLQNITDALPRATFLSIENEIVCSLRLNKVAISTGGSVIYSPEAMKHLASLGPVVLLDVPLPLVLQRIAMHPDRGLVIAPGQTVEDLFAERSSLYHHFATHILDAAKLDVHGCAVAIADMLGLTRS